jgi:hypothetical protein
MSIDPRTGLPFGEKPPASTASVVALAAGFLLCLGPIAGFVAIVAGVIGLRAATKDPGNVGGRAMAISGILLGILNFMIFASVLVILLLGAVAD